jgi:hypothetical protein
MHPLWGDPLRLSLSLSTRRHGGETKTVNRFLTTLPIDGLCPAKYLCIDVKTVVIYMYIQHLVMLQLAFGKLWIGEKTDTRRKITKTLQKNN